MRIGVLGISGFLGSALSRVSALKNGVELVPLLNAMSGPLRLGQSPNEAQLQTLDSVIHLAWSRSSQSNEDSINITGSRELIEACRLSETRLLFASSYATIFSPTTNYAQQKLRVEALCYEENIRAFRIGLVWADTGSIGGPMGSLVHLARIAPFYPQPRSKDIYVHLANIEDVAETLITGASCSVEDFSTIPTNLSHPVPVNLFELMKQLSFNPRLRRIVIPRRLAECATFFAHQVGLLDDGVDSLRGLTLSTATETSFVGSQGYRPFLEVSTFNQS